MLPPTVSRIASIFSQSEGNNKRRVIGTNGDFDTLITDYCYSYFLKKYSGDTSLFSDTNREYVSSDSNYHLFIQRGQVNANHRHGTRIIEFAENIIFQIYVKDSDAIGINEISRELQTIANEVERIFLEYETHSIAGIQYFDNLQIGVIEPPESSGNPYKDVWILPLQLTAYYEVEFMLQPSNAIYNGNKYSAGSFREDF